MPLPSKISRLPRVIRDELNRRLDDGEAFLPLLEWLNGHPDVQRVLHQSFDDRPITDGNLSDWKQGGFIEWQRFQEASEWARAVATESDHIAAESGHLPLSDRLSATVTLALGKLLRELAAGSLSDDSNQEKFIALLKQLTRLRRDDHLAERLRMDREQYEIQLPYRLRQSSLQSIPLRAPPSIP
jgi:hypothetical protein